MAAPGAYVVVTPWYPTAARPHHGVFVREWTRAVGHPRTTVVHLDAVEPGGPPEREQPERRTDGDLTVLRLPVPVAPSTGRVATARAHAAALARALRGEPGLVPPDAVVHAHVGLPGGAAAARALPPHVRLVLTEHASYLPTLLAGADTREEYARTVARAEAVLTVGEHQARLLRKTFPAHAARVTAVGNPVDGARFSARPAPAGPLRRWVTVGNLVPGKGVEHVLAAFERAAQGDPAVELLVVGDGVLRAELEGRATPAERVAFAGAVPPDQVPALLATRDVAVQLSDAETFGLAPLEALLAGLPVVASDCGGPAATLADARARGVADLVPVRPAPDLVVAAVAGLRDPDAVQLARAREAVLARWSPDVVGTRVRRVLAGAAPDPGPAPGAAAVLTVGLDAAASADLAPLHDDLLRQGVPVVHLTASDEAALAQDARVAVLHWPDAARRTGPVDPPAARVARGLASALPGRAGRGFARVERALRSRAVRRARAEDARRAATRSAAAAAAPAALARSLAVDAPATAVVCGAPEALVTALGAVLGASVVRSRLDEVVAALP